MIYEETMRFVSIIIIYNYYTANNDKRADIDINPLTNRIKISAVLVTAKVEHDFGILYIQTKWISGYSFMVLPIKQLQDSFNLTLHKCTCTCMYSALSFALLYTPSYVP